MNKKVYLAGDHAGFKLKEKVKEWLTQEGFDVKDFGPFLYDKNDDYPNFTFPLSEAVARSKEGRGIVIAGSGIGECIAANKVRGIRAVLYHAPSRKLIETSRVHDDANVICLGSRFLSEREVKAGIKMFLKTKFPGEKRHKRRLGKIQKFENKFLTRPTSRKLEVEKDERKRN
jgi:ribose 5-phosphate isomerase B